MATCPDDRYRNSQLALEAAEKAIKLDGRADFKYLDTLAAAYANAGEFDKAKHTIAEAIRIAPKERIAPIQHRQELYQRNESYRQGEQIAERPEDGSLR